MRHLNGTPANLEAAIVKALNELTSRNLITIRSETEMACATLVILTIVKDRMAQDFTTAIMNSVSDETQGVSAEDQIATLFKTVFPKAA